MTIDEKLTIENDQMLPHAIPGRSRDGGIPTRFSRRPSARTSRRGLSRHAHNRSSGPDWPILPWMMSPRQQGIALLRLAFAVTIAVCFWPVTPARSATTNYSMIPSAAMGRDIPVAFRDGGAHPLFLLAALNGGDAVSNWGIAGNAMNALADKGISVVTPARGADASIKPETA
jgi:hypothetical protein